MGDKKRMVLIAIIVAGVFPIAGAAGAMVGLWAAYELRDHDAKQRTKRYLYELERDGYIRRRGAGRQSQYVTTRKGRNVHRDFKLKTLEIPAQQIWDGKLRIAIFDIPVQDNHIRNVVRIKLKLMGFIRLQHSIYAHRYECANEIAKLKEIYDLDDELVLFESSSAELLLLFEKKLSRLKTHVHSKA